VSARWKLTESRNGLMRRWAEPIEGLTYIIGADCAKGTSGDYSAAIVLEAQACSIVAALHDRIPPNAFGRKLAALAWYYNEAILAIETFPAGYGTLACETAINAGYRKMYQRVDHRKASMSVTDDLGWKTDSITSDRMVGRVGTAVNGHYPIPYHDLIEELLAQRWELPKPGTSSGPKIASSRHDDLSDAYAIALLVRDELYQQGTIKAAAPPPQTESERFWSQYHQKLDRMQGHRSGSSHGRR